MRQKAYLDPSSEWDRVERLRRLSGALRAWGCVVGYRQATGNMDIPSLSELTGQAYRRTGSRSLTNLQSNFLDIERALKGTQPIIRGLLAYQFVRPYLRDEEHARVPTSVESYVDRLLGPAVYGGKDVIGLPEHQQESVVRAIKRIRQQWVRHAINTLSPDLYAKRAA